MKRTLLTIAATFIVTVSLMVGGYFLFSYLEQFTADTEQRVQIKTSDIPTVEYERVRGDVIRPELFYWVDYEQKWGKERFDLINILEYVNETYPKDHITPDMAESFEVATLSETLSKHQEYVQELSTLEVPAYLREVKNSTRDCLENAIKGYEALIDQNLFEANLNFMYIYRDLSAIDHSLHDIQRCKGICY